jgi:HD-like signal output (HDOD) protein
MGVLLGAVSIAILLALLAIIRAGRSTPVTPHKRGVAVDTGHREPEEPEAPARAAQPPSAPPAPLPDELAAFALVRTADISPARQAILLEEMERIFLPPRSLRELSSPDFFSSGNTRELSDFLMREPVLAARVLGVVNSPLHGLLTPIVSVQHAINYLGVNTIRSIAMRFLVEESYRTETPSLQTLYKRIWDAGLMGSEICTLLSQRLGFSDIGASATVTVLSFVGDFAVLTLMSPEISLASWEHGLLERSRIQQESLGFGAMVAGDLLLQQWGLPQSVVSGIERAGAILVSPAPMPAGPEALGLALCYLSARIGESIAMGRVTEVDQINLSANGQPELFQLQSYLAQPALAKLPDILQSPEVRLALARMIAATTGH